ncbi:DUF1345 domain-containing protein [Floridanema evergladense]|uniref:DUF1345 domain-containing protein n=1 Tax=Floridaenema evergladense BLCC-F167 TaxID=3153639 RepID=A0ABV4WM20_9CYAN
MNYNVDRPIYFDFLDVVITIGLTYAMSDVNAASDRARCLVLLHSIISFFFYSIIVGSAINAIVTS